MPVDAMNSIIRLITLCDASKTNSMLGVCKLIIGTSPKLELEGICSAANLGWIVRNALKRMGSYLYSGD